MRGQKTWGKNVGNRSNNRTGMVNGKYYRLSGLDYKKYSLEHKGI
jgi:hypothetical protein